MLGLALVLALTLAVDTFFFAGFLATSDDNCYLLAAHRLATGQPLVQPGDADEHLLAIMRLAVTLPLGVASFLARGRIFWVAYASIFYHLALVVVAWFTARLIHRPGSAWLAAILVALSPLCYFYAGTALPDLALTMWMGLATMALLMIQKNEDMAEAKPGRALLLAALAGILNGLAYSCKSTGLILIVPAALALAMSAPRLISTTTLMRGLVFGLGLLAIMGAEIALISYISGHWTWRPSMLSQFASHYVYRMSLEGIWPHHRAHLAYSWTQPLMPWSLWPLLLAGVIYPFLKCSQRWLSFAFWWMVVYLTIGSTGLTQYLPPTIQPRYYSVVVIPAALMMAQVVWSFLGWLKGKAGTKAGRWLGATVLALPLMMSGLDLYHNLEEAGEIYRARQVRSFLEALDNARTMRPKLPIVLSHALSDRMLALFLQDPNKLVIRTQFYHHFLHPVPEPPFIMLEDWQLRGPEGLTLDLPPRPDGKAYRYQVLKIVKPGFGRYDTWLQGNALAGLNPVLAEQRIRIGGKFDTAILFVTIAQ